MVSLKRAPILSVPTGKIGGKTLSGREKNSYHGHFRIIDNIIGIRKKDERLSCRPDPATHNSRCRTRAKGTSVIAAGG
jgi:hypothetical protein